MLDSGEQNILLFAYYLSWTKINPILGIGPGILNLNPWMTTKEVYPKAQFITVYYFCTTYF